MNYDLSFTTEIFRFSIYVCLLDVNEFLGKKINIY